MCIDGARHTTKVDRKTHFGEMFSLIYVNDAFVFKNNRKKTCKLQYKCLTLQCVFHGIRFKVNKRLGFSGIPFFMPISLVALCLGVV